MVISNQLAAAAFSRDISGRWRDGAVVQRARLESLSTQRPHGAKTPKVKGDSSTFSVDTVRGLQRVGSASVPLAVGRVSRPTSWPDPFLWILLRLGGVARDPIQSGGRPGCIWRDAKYRARDARAPRKHRRSIWSTENVEEPISISSWRVWAGACKRRKCRSDA